MFHVLVSEVKTNNLNLVTVPFDVMWFVGSVFVCAGPETFAFVKIYFRTRCALVSDSVGKDAINRVISHNCQSSVVHVLTYFVFGPVVNLNTFDIFIVQPCRTPRRKSNTSVVKPFTLTELEMSVYMILIHCIKIG